MFTNVSPCSGRLALVSTSLTSALLFALLASGTSFAQQKAADDFVKFYQWRIARDPDDYFNYDKLGVAYIRKGRETGDIGYYELAEKALQKSLQLESTHREAVTATAHLASVYFAEHRFSDALQYARKCLTFGTGDLSPYATIGDALIELGEYDQASTTYSHLKEPESSPAPHEALRYLQETRSSNLDFLKGDTQSSILHMRNAVRIAHDTQMPSETLAWTQFSLGEELFQIGDLENAETANQDALTTYPGYHRALAGLAKVRCAQGRFQDAIELYKKALAVIPMPAYAAALGDLFSKLGRAEEARKQYDLVEFIGNLSAINQTIYNRELGLFYADHDLKLREALEYARRELSLRHDIYTWDCLAWVLYKNGQTSEAADAISRALALGTRDALLFFHAGMIYARLPDPTKARDLLMRALATNPHFHVLYAAVAEQTLQSITDPQPIASGHGTRN